MLSKNKIKFIKSIKKKKYREIHQCFFVEGEKLLDELLFSDFKLIEIFATSEWIKKNKDKIKANLNLKPVDISEGELQNISSLATPNNVFAVVKLPKHSYDISEIQSELSLLLDNISDPGNLGTIVRIADWFGIKNIFCSMESVDVFNPKVVQASMGAIFRTKIHYVGTETFLSELSQIKNFPVYGTFLDGDNIYSESLDSKGLIIMGSESHGISEQLKPCINRKLFIPNYPKGQKTSESLNVSTATAIICSEFRRRSDQVTQNAMKS